MWSSYSVTDGPPVTGTANCCNSSDSAGRGDESGGGGGGGHVINGGTDSADPLLGLVALQLTVLVFISALGTFANALVFAVFYRRPSLRTISNRFVLSLIMANLMSAAVSIPGHVYQLLIKPVHQDQEHHEQQERFQGHRQLDHHHDREAEDNGGGGGLSAGGSSVGGGIGDDVSYLMGRLLLADDSTSSSWFSSWHWHKQGLDGLTVLVSLASVLSILLISLDRYYAVNSPLHYSIIVTRQKSIAMIALVWLVAAILSAPVWAGSVLLQHYAPVMRTSTPQVVASAVNTDGGAHLLFDGGGLFVNNESLPTGLLDDELHGNGSSRDQQMQQQYLMNLCYSISLILFGFVWPLAALCWLYLRMYEAALKNSARTRRQSLCSNTNNNANATDGIVGVAAAAAASTVAATASSNAEPSVCSYGTTGAAAHQPTLADAITSVTTTASAFASENQASARLLAAASASTPQRLRSNRYWLRFSGMQQQLLTLFWREQGRPLRTTAMVISSFTCCWLPFFVWLLPFQIHPSLMAAAGAGTLDRAEATRSTTAATAASAGVFLARLAAFSNVLISPAIYVYRNQVAQREAGRVLLLLFCPFRHQRRQSTRYNSHDIATPLVMGGLGVSGMTSSQLHHPQSGEARLRRNSNAVNSSRRSSSLVTNNSTDSPTRKGSDEPMTVMALAQATVVNWRGRSGSTDCRLLTKNNGTITTQLVSETAGVAQQQPQHSLYLPPAVPSPLLGTGKPRRQQGHNKPRASIPGACCTYSLDRRPSSSTSSSSHVDLHQIEMRQRSQTISETRLASTSRLLENPGRLSPSRAVTAADPSPRSGEASTNVSSSNIIQMRQPNSSTMASSGTSGDRGRSKKRTSSTTAAAAAAAAAAVAAAELKALNHPLAYYPSLDFFDIGLEDYGRRSATSSFSHFIQQQPAPLAAPVAPSTPQSTPTAAAATTPLIPPTPSQPSGGNNSGRRRRTCSFSKVMSRSTKQQPATGGPANSRWPAVFGGKQQQQEILGKSSASSMPSVQQIPSLVTAV